VSAGNKVNLKSVLTDWGLRDLGTTATEANDIGIAGWGVFDSPSCFGFFPLLALFRTVVPRADQSAERVGG
jgi:hypothetical protein